MKKLLLVVAGAAMMGLTSCEKVKDLIKFNVGVHSQDVSFSVPAIPVAGEGELAAATVQLNVDSIIKAENKNVGVDNIRSAKVKEVTIEILNADDKNNMAIVESVKVLLSSDQKTEVITIAELHNNPDAFATSMTIPADNVDLSDYLKSHDYYYKLQAKTRRGTTKVLRCKATVKYDLAIGME